MKGILGFLARANLLELSEDEKQTAAGIATDSVAEVVLAPVAEVPSPPPPLSTSELEVTEGKSFDEVFAAAAVPASPYPAEKLLRLLDGLRAMDSATRKVAVLAMDAADDSWQIADCVSDAQQKVAALGAYKQYLGSQLQGSEQQATVKMNDIRAELDAASVAIRQQIAELEQLLERKITQSAQQTASIETGLRAAREAIAREARRLDSEIDRLREIPAQFTTAAPAYN